MDKVYGWSVKRAGATMTVTHNSGKITGVAEIVPYVPADRPGQVVSVAVHADGRKWELAGL